MIKNIGKWPIFVKGACIGGVVALLLWPIIPDDLARLGNMVQYSISWLSMPVFFLATFGCLLLGVDIFSTSANPSAVHIAVGLALFIVLICYGALLGLAYSFIKNKTSI